MFVNFSVFYSCTCKAVEWDGMPHYKFPLILNPLAEVSILLVPFYILNSDWSHGFFPYPDCPYFS